MGITSSRPPGEASVLRVRSEAGDPAAVVGGVVFTICKNTPPHNVGEACGPSTLFVLVDMGEGVRARTGHAPNAAACMLRGAYEEDRELPLVASNDTVRRSYMLRSGLAGVCMTTALGKGRPQQGHAAQATCVLVTGFTLQGSRLGIGRGGPVGVTQATQGLRHAPHGPTQSVGTG